MRKLLYIFCITCIIFSCSKDNGNDKYPQEWRLITMSGQTQNSTTSGSEMAWQESYILNSNRTFTKSRVRNGILSEACGTFEFKDIEDGKYLVLTFSTDSPIIGSCTSDKKETFWIRSDSKMSGTWSYCDGPGLEYERVNY